MKISMWMIVEKLEKYHPKYSIVDGTARITGVRFISDEGDTVFQSQYVYLSMEDAPFPYNASDSAVLVNGNDVIILQGRDTNEIINDLLAVFDFFNAWETTLWEASAHKSYQQIIDMGNSVLDNPMMVSDMDGNVLAMSSAFIHEDINADWIESRNTGHVPTAILGAPMHTLDGSLSSWSDHPQIYELPDGTKMIGTFLSLNGDLIAGFGLWEHTRPIIPSDICLVQVLYEVLLSTIDAQKSHEPMRSITSILSDLLSGVRIDEDLLQHLDVVCTSPWRLLVIKNLFRSDVVHKRSLLQRLQTASLPCETLLYGDHVIALTFQDQALPLLDIILDRREKPYYLIGVSLPFDDLQSIQVRYTQTLFAIRQAGEQPGVYMGEDYAFQHLISLFLEQNEKQGLIHPALGKLRQYDAEKNSDLYETLYQYLLHERSVLQGAQAIHIHKNSLLYRLQRIHSIVNIDLDDPMMRCYLLLSYLLEKA